MCNARESEDEGYESRSSLDSCNKKFPTFISCVIDWFTGLFTTDFMITDSNNVNGKLPFTYDLHLCYAFRRLALPLDIR